jgi:hypothetical protein
MSDDKEKVVNALGGTRGLIDSGLPALVFMVSFYFTKEIRPSVTYALILSALLTLARLIKKDIIQHALSGLFGVAICALFATKTGKAENFYLPGLIINVVYGSLYLFLNLIKLPILGLILGPILGENLAWRKDPIRRAAYIKAGWLWVGLFFGRLAVQYPLYRAGNVEMLGIARLVMGYPLFIAVAWGSWLIIRDVPKTKTEPA